VLAVISPAIVTTGTSIFHPDSPEPFAVTRVAHMHERAAAWKDGCQLSET